MKIRVVNSLILILCMVASLAQAAVATPDAVIKQTADAVIERIKAQRTELDANPSKIYDVVNELVIPHYDFTSMSKWVLGKNWKSATETQRSDFITQFQTLLVRTYARALLEYSGQEIKYFPVEINTKSKLALVKTEMMSDGAQPFPVAYRMHQKNDKWKVVDVSVDGVSLVSTYRGSFSTQIKKHGFESLINELTVKNERLASSISK
ncbi:MAG: phospholipid transport system substrate-binding protein [Gammaproteobacteria bacterium]|jgi:phospholipid transport system substrate-binding protein